MQDMLRNPPSSSTPSSQPENNSCCIPNNSPSRVCGGGAAPCQHGRHQHSNSPEAGDSSLAREMYELTFQERQRVLEEVHGVAPTQDESDISSKLQALDSALVQIPKGKPKKAYEKAIFLRPGLLTDQTFKLSFLRADSYDAVKAAHRMVRYFDTKLQFFGEDKLVRDITLEDFDPKMVDFMVRSGCHVILPNKDQTGRPIFLTNMNKIDWKHAGSDTVRIIYYEIDVIIHHHHHHPGGVRTTNRRETKKASFLLLQVHFAWYLLMSAVSGDEDAEKKGLARVTYVSGSNQNCGGEFQHSGSLAMSQITDLLMRGRQMLSSLPMRFTSYHFCHDDPRMEALSSLIRYCFGKEIRLHLRTHYGMYMYIYICLLDKNLQKGSKSPVCSSGGSCIYIYILYTCIEHDML
jgi:hypothetical protein